MKSQFRHVALIGKYHAAVLGGQSGSVRAALEDHREKALELQRRYEPLMEMNAWEPSPGPVKCALSLMKRCGDTLRLPLVPVRDETRRRVEKVLASYKLLPGPKKKATRG